MFLIDIAPYRRPCELFFLQNLYLCRRETELKMAFKIAKTLVGQLPPVITLPSKASEAYTLGEALVISGGVLTKAGAAVKPTYICEETYTAPATGNRAIRVHAVQDFYIYETTMTSNADTVVIGDLVTLHTDGATLTSVETSGVATVLWKESDAAGAKAHCKF
jgi:hypothetical protein